MEAEIVRTDALPSTCKLTRDGKEIRFELSAEIKMYMHPPVQLDYAAPSYRPNVPPIYGLFLDGKPYLYTTYYTGAAYDATPHEWHLEFPSEYLLQFSPCLG